MIFTKGDGLDRCSVIFAEGDGLDECSMIFAGLMTSIGVKTTGNGEDDRRESTAMGVTSQRGYSGMAASYWPTVSYVIL